jgi:hypothetical protein
LLLALLYVGVLARVVAAVTFLFSLFLCFCAVCLLEWGWFLDLCAVVGSLGRMGLLVLLTREGLVID